jgi:hypothetical protein
LILRWNQADPNWIPLVPRWFEFEAAITFPLCLSSVCVCVCYKKNILISTEFVCVFLFYFILVYFLFDDTCMGNLFLWIPLSLTLLRVFSLFLFKISFEFSFNSPIFLKVARKKNYFSSLSMQTIFKKALHTLFYILWFSSFFCCVNAPSLFFPSFFFCLRKTWIHTQSYAQQFRLSEFILNNPS